MASPVSQYLEQKKPSRLLLLAITLLLGGVGYVAYTRLLIREEPSRDQQQTQNSLPAYEEEQYNSQLLADEINTSEWETYRNEHYGFELQYPKHWTALEKRSSLEGNIGIGFFETEEIDQLRSDLIQYHSSKNYPLFYYLEHLPEHKVVHPPYLTPAIRRQGVSELEPKLVLMIEFYPEIKDGFVGEPPVINFLGKKEKNIRIDGHTFSIYPQGSYECYDGDTCIGTDGIYAFTCNKNGICLQIISERIEKYDKIKYLILNSILSAFQFPGQKFDNIEN